MTGPIYWDSCRHRYYKGGKRRKRVYVLVSMLQIIVVSLSHVHRIANFEHVIISKLCDLWMKTLWLRHILLIEAEWRIYALVNYAIICSDKGLSPIRCQAILSERMVVICWFDPLEQTSLKFEYKCRYFIQENASENFGKMVTSASVD